jgi:hypothetical protein
MKNIKKCKQIVQLHGFKLDDLNYFASDMSFFAAKWNAVKDAVSLQSDKTYAMLRKLPNNIAVLRKN